MRALLVTLIRIIRVYENITNVTTHPSLVNFTCLTSHHIHYHFMEILPPNQSFSMNTEAAEKPNTSSIALQNQPRFKAK